MKKFYLLFILFFLSCNSKVDELSMQLDLLKSKNDSLQTIIDTLKTKYIFDNAGLRILTSVKNSDKIGSEFNGEAIIQAYNNSDNILFGRKGHSKDFKLIDPDTLKTDYGGYRFKIIRSDNDSAYFKVFHNKNLGEKLDNEILMNPLKTFP